MTRADRKNAVLRKTRLKFQRPFAVAGRPLAHNYEALSKTRYNSVRISNFGLKFLQYILNILYFRIKQKKFRFFQPKLPDYYLKITSYMGIQKNYFFKNKFASLQIVSFCIKINSGFGRIAENILTAPRG